MFDAFNPVGISHALELAFIPIKNATTRINCVTLGFMLFNVELLMFFFSDHNSYDLSANARVSQTAQSVMAFPALAHRFNRVADFNEGNWIASQPFHIACPAFLSWFRQPRSQIASGKRAVAWHS